MNAAKKGKASGVSEGLAISSGGVAVVGGEDAREGLGSSRGHAASEQCWETSMTNEWVGLACFSFFGGCVSLLVVTATAFCLGTTFVAAVRAKR